MISIRLIAHCGDMTAAAVIVDNGYHVITTITKSANIVVGWINEVVLRQAPPANTDKFQVVGLHIERFPPDNAIALLQLFVGHHCLLYQLPPGSSAFAPAELYGFLCDSRFCFAGVGMEEVRNALWREHGFLVRNARDLGDAASRRLGREDLRRAGLEQLAIEVMWFFINKLEEVLNPPLYRSLPLLRARQISVILGASSIS